MQSKTFEPIPISNVTVGQRFRKDMDDLDTLAQSIKEHGLLQPILVNGNLELIAGGRRLEACKKLKWKKISALIVDTQDIIDGEIQENVGRKEFNTLETVAVKRYMQSNEKELATERMRAGKPVSDSDRGRVDDRIAKYFGISRDTLYKQEKIVEAAEKDPQKYGNLLRMVDEGKIRVNRAYKQVAKETKDVKELRPLIITSNPSTAKLSENGEEIDFKFSLSCKELKNHIETILMLYGSHEKNPQIWIDGKVNTRTGNVVYAKTGAIADHDDDRDKELRMPRKEPLIGFTLSFAEEVSINPGHTMVCGLTQESGKSTALEGFLSRWAEKKILVIICKNGEEVFQQYKKVAPFIREDAAKSEFPRTEFSHKLQLAEGIQKMDLHDLDAQTQGAIVGSVAEEILDPTKNLQDVVLVILDARQILPRSRPSPAKLPVEGLMRQGAAKGNFVVLDSQDLSGIDVPIRKQGSNWIIGKLNEINEIRLVIEHLTIQAGEIEFIKQSIQNLTLGQFYVQTRGKLSKTFAWPVWMSFSDALDCTQELQIVYKIKKEKVSM